MSKTLLSLFSAVLLSVTLSATPTVVAIVEDEIVFIGQNNSAPSIVLASIVEDEIVF